MSIIRKVDCIQLYVSDLTAGLDFYCNKLGHELHILLDTRHGLFVTDADKTVIGVEQLDHAR